MGLYGIEVVYRSNESSLAMHVILEESLLVPHLHECPYDSFCFSVCLWGFHLCESLLDPVFGAEFHEGVILTISPVFQPVVRVDGFDGVGTLIDHLSEKRFA